MWHEKKQGARVGHARGRLDVHACCRYKEWDADNVNNGVNEYDSPFSGKTQYHTEGAVGTLVCRCSSAAAGQSVVQCGWRVIDSLLLLC